MASLKDFSVLVTPPGFGRGDQNLREELESRFGRVIFNHTGRPLSAKELVKIIPGFEGYIAGLDAITSGALGAADRLKVISRYGVGVDNIDMQAAAAKGIVVTNTPGVNAVSVAELTIALILSLARNLPAQVEAARFARWQPFSGISLVGKTVGLLGLGFVGKQVARRLDGFDCRLLVEDSSPDMDFIKFHRIELVGREALLQGSDFVSLHLPLNGDTFGMVNAEFLKAMKTGSFLINTARPELVDERALIKALKAEHLRGAALDTLRQEPPAYDNPLLKMESVIITPHCGSHTDAATNAMGWTALEDCCTVLLGGEPAHRVGD